MKFQRLYSTADCPVAEQVEWKTVEAKILGKGDEVIFHMPAVEVPAQWSQDATNILAQKYLRKAGVPSKTK
jgi:ribonucleoside-diphosphate reductase alpha chain